MPQLFLLNDICFEFIKELKATSDKQIISEFFLIKLHRYRELVTPEELKSELMTISKQVEKNEERKVVNDENSMLKSKAEMVAEVFEGEVVTESDNKAENINQKIIR